MHVKKVLTKQRPEKRQHYIYIRKQNTPKPRTGTPELFWVILCWQTLRKYNCSLPKRPRKMLFEGTAVR